MESKTAHLAAMCKVKSRGKRGIFFLLVFSPFLPNREGLRVGWALEAEEIKNLSNARGSVRLASKQGPRKWGKIILICRNSKSWRQDKVLVTLSIST